MGSILVEDATKQEAESIVKEEISEWQNQYPVYLSYNEQKVQLSPDTWLFQVEESVQKISGNSNKLLVELDKESVKSSVFKLNVTGLEELLDEEMLYAHLKQVGAKLPTSNLEININEFLTTFGQAEEVVSQSTVKLPGEHVLLADWIKGLHGYEIKPGSSFSLIHAIEEVSLTAQDSIDLNVLASGIYTAVQKTNFTIVERHTSRELPEYAELGFEAFVKPADMDFSFQNPNAAPYKLEFLIDKDHLVVSIVGVPLPFTYKVKVDKQVFKPKTIIRFNEQLASFLSSVVVDGGSEGYLAAVYRESFGSGGEVVESIKLSEDFYPPKHRIEERGYPVEDKEVPDTTNPENGIPVMPYPYPVYPYPANPFDPNAPVIPGIPGIPGADAQPPTENVKDNKVEEKKKTPSDDEKESGGEAK
ncbi:VanW family protein [Fictibacillus sp. BK138]|uniref:VanW family protein n=1 Tax=Fictibacillus sp. BK138 TaxID=2512121 RepID=UPI0013EEBE61|nr:VanW family protein [Fictibacillus sp. BK138]